MEGAEILKKALYPRFVVLSAALLCVAAAAAPADRPGPLRLAVRVFEIPAEQSFEVERPDGRGGTVSLHVSGNVTADFPEGTLFIPTELARNTSESTIGEAIGRRVRLGCGDLPAEHVTVRELKSWEFILDAGHPAEEARFEESRGEGRTADYHLRVAALDAGAEKPVVRFDFDAGSSWRGGTLSGGMSSRVIATVAEVPDSRLLLIGAPGDKAIYILAVCAQQR